MIRLPWLLSNAFMFFYTRMSSETCQQMICTIWMTYTTGTTCWDDRYATVDMERTRECLIVRAYWEKEKRGVMMDDKNDHNNGKTRRGSDTQSITTSPVYHPSPDQRKASAFNNLIVMVEMKIIVIATKISPILVHVHVLFDWYFDKKKNGIMVSISYSEPEPVFEVKLKSERST